jgi:hypothetical protein
MLNAVIRRLSLASPQALTAMQQRVSMKALHTKLRMLSG